MYELAVIADILASWREMYVISLQC